MPWPAEVLRTRPIRKVPPHPVGTLRGVTMRLLAKGLARSLGPTGAGDGWPGGDGVVPTTAFLDPQDDLRPFVLFAGRRW